MKIDGRRWSPLNVALRPMTPTVGEELWEPETSSPGEARCETNDIGGRICHSNGLARP